MAETKSGRKTAAEKKAERASKSKGRLFKYMGDSHVRIIEKGDTFGNQYPDGIEDTLTWNYEDGHLVDSDDHPDVSDEAWELLAEEDDFIEVTGRKTIPRSIAEDRWAPRSATPNLVAPDGVAGNANPVGGGPSASGNVTSDTGASAGSGTGVTGAAT